MSVLILGPSKWRARHCPELPGWIPRHYPEGWSPRVPRRLSPLDIRAAMVGTLVAAGCEASMMELHSPLGGETHTALFERLVRELRVGRFLTVASTSYGTGEDPAQKVRDGQSIRRVQ